MNIKLARVFVVLALISSALVGIFNAATASADAPPQTSLTVTKYDADGNIANTTTVTYQWLEAHLAVQGDGITHYYTEGPTFDPNNLWDPTEICPGDSLKDKGALKGTDLKDLCDLVGGAAHGDTVKVLAADGYNDVFDAENIYSPVPRQGPIVICWYKDGQYTGNWTDGMLLAFFTTVGRASDGLLIFGHQDMHDCLPESDWHYYYDGAIQYPSTDGLWVKWINSISIYTGNTTGWSIQLHGNRNDIVDQTWFENGIACQHGGNYTDGNGTWGGMPLGFLCGLVDDTTNIHGPGAFNFDLARAGYDVTVISGDGNTTTFPSTQLVKNGSISGDILVANTLDGNPLPSDQYPLKLVGADVPGNQTIGNISSIVLSNFPPFIQASDGSGGSISPYGNVQPSPGGNVTFTITPNMGYHISGVTVDGLSVGAVGNYTFYNVAGYHTIAASFLTNTCVITASASAGGSISPSGNVTVGYGGNQTFTIAATYGYRILGVNVDGSSGGAVSTYTFINVATAHTIAASFTPVWNLNGDHVCNIGDVVMIGLHWDERGTPGWIPEDVSPNGKIDIGDVVVIGLHWGETW